MVIQWDQGKCHSTILMDLARGLYILQTSPNYKSYSCYTQAFDNGIKQIQLAFYLFSDKATILPDNMDKLMAQPINGNKPPSNEGITFDNVEA